MRVSESIVLGCSLALAFIGFCNTKINSEIKFHSEPACKVESVKSSERTPLDDLKDEATDKSIETMLRTEK